MANDQENIDHYAGICLSSNCTFGNNGGYLFSADLDISDCLRRIWRPIGGCCLRCSDIYAIPIPDFRSGRTWQRPYKKEIGMITVELWRLFMDVLPFVVVVGMYLITATKFHHIMNTINIDDEAEYTVREQGRELSKRDKDALRRMWKTPRDSWDDYYRKCEIERAYRGLSPIYGITLMVEKPKRKPIHLKLGDDGEMILDEPAAELNYLEKGKRE